MSVDVGISVGGKREMKSLRDKTERSIIKNQGVWYKDLRPCDWLFDGHPIRSERELERWRKLDWSKAYVDLGPSISGNLGPYWHVPLRSEDETVHRLYPKLLLTKWARVFRQAALEYEMKLP